MVYIGAVTIEILAILCGLKLAWWSEVRYVVLESDCSEAINAVEVGCIRMHWKQGGLEISLGVQSASCQILDCRNQAHVEGSE